MPTPFEEIFRHHPELQNKYSSSWWFFLLIPENDTGGYGPQQMMFTYASRVGNKFGVLDTWQNGVSLEQGKFDVKSMYSTSFPTRVAGWIYDGQKVHKNIVFTPAMVNISEKDRYVEAWRTIDSEKYGGELRASTRYKTGIDAEYRGKNGSASFTAFGEDKDNEVEMPQLVEWRGLGRPANVNTIAWRRFKFDGTFRYSGQEIEARGIGYFQRVLMNIPLQPWQWNYTVFNNGSIFSSFMMYTSFNLFRRSFQPLTTFMRRRRFHIIPSAYFYDSETGKTHYFDTARIIPDVGKGRQVKGFYISASGKDEELRFYTKSRDKTGYNLKNHLFRNYYSIYSWNEYIVEVQKLVGKLNNKILSLEKLGQGFGNVEYSMGISL